MASFDEPTSIISLILGFILLALGLIPILNTWGVIGFGLPGFLSGILQGIIIYIVAAAGAWLLINGFLEDDAPRWITLAIAGLVLIMAIIPILNQFGIIGFGLGFLTYNVFLYVFVVEGLLMVLFPFLRT